MAESFELEHAHLDTNGIRLHVVQAGPAQGPLAILLHGFPEFWYSWRRQIPHLAAAGFRVWAPDQRGYNLSDKPKGRRAFRVEELAADVIGLVQQSGRERIHLVGHDWGGAVAWWIALHYPQILERLVLLNIPHPAVMLRNLKRNPAQMCRSWYVLFFQLPWLPEALSRAGHWRWPARALRKTSRPGTFSDADLAMYREAWSQPGAFTSMLNWYRALTTQRLQLPGNPRISVPTLLLWGCHDGALGREMAQPSIDLCDHGRLVLFEEATHWVHEDEPDRVNELLTQFLQAEAG